LRHFFLDTKLAFPYIALTKSDHQKEIIRRMAKAVMEDRGSSSIIG